MIKLGNAPKTKQPKWELLANLGDVNPLDHGGYFVYRDLTGVYEAEAELLMAPDEDDQVYTVHRFPLDKLKQVKGSFNLPDLVPAKYDSTWPHPPGYYDTWFNGDADRLAAFAGYTPVAFRALFCSDNPLARAAGYRIVGEYHGFDNLDSYPLTLSRAEVEERYKK